MKKAFLIGLVLIVFLISGCTNNSKVVATVNDVEILQGELEKQMVLTEMSYSINGYDFPESNQSLNELREEMLSNVAESYVLVDLAKKKGIKIDEDAAKSQSDSLIEGMISIYGSDEKYESFLKEKGQDRTNFDEYIYELAKSNEYIYDLYDEVTKEITVTSDEVEKFYEENAKYYDYSTVSVMSIAIENEKTANSIYDKITGEKMDFEDAMAEYEGEDGIIGVSDLGTLYYGDPTKEFSETAFDMSIGDISKPFVSENIYYIINVYGKDEQTPMSYDEIKDTVESDLLNQKKALKYDEFFKTEKKAYTITITK